MAPWNPILRSLLLPAALLAACTTDVSLGKRTVDADSDGYAAEVDCDDAHATVNPDAPERCDGLDNDCDGAVDDDAEDATAWFADLDGDGHGDASAATGACEAPPGTVATADDCDDTVATTFPGAPETCNGADDDCDGATDEEATDAQTWFTDLDGDGYGDPATATLACDAGSDEVLDGTDCDDAAAAVHPGAPEPDCADPRDYNCDGSTGYADADADGTAACDDCDDTDGAVHPGATEVCDGAGVDEDCDTLVNDDDDSVTATTTWGRDADGDGWAGSGPSLDACAAPAGTSATFGDCDDADAGVNPAAPEVCDAADTDEDCSGAADDADLGADPATWSDWYADADGDGYGDATRSARQCDAPPGYGPDATDCDDGAASVHPGATEVCDPADVDEDCDGLADDADTAPSGTTVWYADLDGDTFGDASASASACDVPAGHVADATDCDDGAASVHPGATEVCDPADVDEDCDGLADDADTAPSGTTVWYADTDGDTFGDASASVSACDAPAGHVADTTDCDDGAAGIHPGATEVCDPADVDEDCDGLADDADTAPSGTTVWYADLDGDTYGDAAAGVSACDAPADHVLDTTDCDDADANTFPGGVEVCDDGVDQDCDGVDEACPTELLSGTYNVDSGFDGRIYGVAARDEFGLHMASGDFDGDGDGDLIVAAVHNVHTTYEGTVYGFLGPLTHQGVADTVADFGYYNTVSSFEAYFGQWLAAVGDRSGDGTDDFAITDGGMTGSIYYLPDSGFSGYTTYDDQTFTCTAADDAGTFNLTGSTEWVCGNWTSSSSSGYARVYSGTSSSTVTTLLGEDNSDYAGGAVAGGGDVDGDGLTDLWVGAWGEDQGGADAGAVYLWYGASTGSHDLSTADAKVYGEAAGDNLGEYLHMPGDLDGDGHDDVLANAVENDENGASCGAIYLLTDDSSGRVDTVAHVALYGETSADRLGYTEATSGDFDGDGQRDLAVGAPIAACTVYNSGTAWLMYGPVASGTDLASADAEWCSTETLHVGAGLIGVPDTDGDGDDELAIGAYYATIGGDTRRGAVWIWNGGS